MDITKLRVLAAVAGILVGLGAILTLFVAATFGLAEVIGMEWSAFAVGSTGFLLAAACLFFCLQPFRSMEEEVEDVEEVTADALADLPFDAVRSFVQRRPLTTTAVAVMIGYSLVSNPRAAQRHAERFFMSML